MLHKNVKGNTFSKVLTGMGADSIWVRRTEKGCNSLCLPDTPECTAE